MEAHQIAVSTAAEVVVSRTRTGTFATRVLDVVVAATVLLLALPLLLLIAVLIRLDSHGAPVFRQRRLGRGKREFTLHKLRTMSANADQNKHRSYVEALIEGEGEAVCDENGKTLYKLAVDDRITRIGRWLRKTSLDELPQLWDVLRGHMSLVGPRPVLAYEADCFPSWYDERFSVKPGLTGLWQVSGRNERTYEEMIELDIDYARSKSLWLDITILMKTVRLVCGRQGVA
jgi:lipopolysaccharide/colanic/teichoic acid biosynthesis glycosyltransferase